MNQITFSGILFFAIELVGFCLAYLYGRKTKQFRWSEYVAIIILPIAAILAFAIFIDIKILSLFFASCAIGFFLEYLGGFVYHKTLNERLWQYDRLSINGYTSLLSIPFWGIGGCTFWVISKIVGL